MTFGDEVLAAAAAARELAGEPGAVARGEWADAVEVLAAAAVRLVCTGDRGLELTPASRPS